jgi:hypothetical protein
VSVGGYKKGKERRQSDLVVESNVTEKLSNRTKQNKNAGRASLTDSSSHAMIAASSAYSRQPPHRLKLL